ncbi:MAG: UDP-glucose/GDP-mannose dehydrogenase family protein [Dehalococcoidia bacterium]|nr:MAG: UDP-glucose/GDP-mannose dehydrogenase family protein [Dehalococcoidia bacterium]
MKVAVIVAGYVGLVTGACFAKLGNEVVIIDIDEKKLKAINNGISPIYEEGLDELLRQICLEVSSDYGKVSASETVMLCLGTPSDENGTIVLDYMIEASKRIAEMLRARSGYSVVTVKSTVPPGTTEEVVIPILETSGKKAGQDFGVCMCPEFLREGKAIYDFMHPARVVIGEYDSQSGDVLDRLYQDFKVPIMRTDLKTAEMIKLASNAYLATKISFINEIGNLCKRLGIDVYEVARGMALDDRIGSQFLNAGVGFGGSCLPKDLIMLIAKAKETGYKPAILEGIANFNDAQALRMVELLKKHLTLRGATIGLLGLAFKPGTDDVRDSRAIKIVEALLDEGARVRAYDPLAADNFRRLFPQIEYASKEAVLNSDAILIVTEWAEFKDIDYRRKIVIDGRRIDKAREAKIYEGIGW